MQLLCAPHQLLWISILTDLSICGTKVEMLAQGKKKWPAAWKYYYEWRKRTPANKLSPVATAEERLKAKYRRQFRQWKHAQYKEYGEYWNWDIDEWETFKCQMNL